MKVLFRWLLMVVICGVTVGPAFGNTWRVELDGSGDYLDIQPAVEASAAGDTVLIGPGRFDTFHPCVAPAWTEEAIVVVSQDSLTFIGSGQDVTIIGTETYYGPDWEQPKGFCAIDGKHGVIENLTIENVDTCVYWSFGSLELRNCTIRGDHSSFGGMALWLDGGGVIENCRFEVSGNGSACSIKYPSQNVEIRNNVFEGWCTGVISSSPTSGINVSGCTFEGCYKGVVFHNGSSGSAVNSTFNNCTSEAVSAMINSSVICNRLTINGGVIGFDIRAGSSVIADSIVIDGTTDYAIAFSNQSQVSFNNSDILPASGWAVFSWAFSLDHVTADFSNNFWGTTDTALIDAMIQDSQDDPDIHCTVQYEPFASGPVPTEKKSLGSIKAMFRGATR